MTGPKSTNGPPRRFGPGPSRFRRGWARRWSVGSPVPTPLSNPWAVLFGLLLVSFLWARGVEASPDSDRIPRPTRIDPVDRAGGQDPAGAVGQVVRALERSPFPAGPGADAALVPYGREQLGRHPAAGKGGPLGIAEDPVPTLPGGLLERGVELSRAVLFDAWGNEVALGDLRGRVLVLAFPCGSPRDAVLFSELAADCVERYGERRFLWMTVHRGLAPQKLLSFLESRPSTLELHVLEGSVGDSMGGVGGSDGAHSIHGMLDVHEPAVHWIDAEGRWRGAIANPRDLEESLGSWIDVAETAPQDRSEAPPGPAGESEGGER